MPSFEASRDFTRNLVITLTNGDTLKMKYCPGRLNTDFWLRYTDLNNLEVRDDNLITLVGHSWDWTDAKGKVIPITGEFLKEQVGVMDRLAIARAIYADVFPTQKAAEELTTVSNGITASASTEEKTPGPI